MNKLNILIIENELITYMYITKILKSCGLKNIHVARSSNEAIEISSNIKIDILISDIEISGDIDGIAIASTLQSLYNFPVIFITAFKDKDMLKRIAKIDIVGYLLKPFNVDELKVLIELTIIKFNLLEENYLIKYKDYYYNKETFELKRDKKQIILAKKEQFFVSLLFQNINTIIRYEIIDKTVWYETYVSENTRRTFLYRFKNRFPEFDFKTEKNIGVGMFL